MKGEMGNALLKETPFLVNVSGGSFLFSGPGPNEAVSVHTSPRGAVLDSRTASPTTQNHLWVDDLSLKELRSFIV